MDATLPRSVTAASYGARPLARVSVMLVLAALSLRSAPADPPVPAGAPATAPLVPESAADAVLAALTAQDGAALRAIAAEDAPDPWLVADELLSRGRFDAAVAFAKAAPRADVEALPAYIESRRDKPEDAARRTRLAAANRALTSNKLEEALEALGGVEPLPLKDVVAVRLTFGRGLALEALRRPNDAVKMYVVAGEAAESMGWLARAANAFQRAASTSYGAASYPAAKSAWERELKLSERRGDKRGAAAALGNVGIAAFALGDLAGALASEERALAAQEAIGDDAGAALTLGNIGVTQRALGNFAKALETQTKALKVKQALGDRAGAALSLRNIADLHQVVGDYTKALAAYVEVFEQMKALGDEQGVAAALVGLGNAREGLGEHAEALASFEKALAMTKAQDDRAAAAVVLGNIGEVHRSLGNYARALAIDEEALAANEALGDKVGAALTRRNIGAVRWAMGDGPAALAAYRIARAALDEAGDKAGAAMTLGDIAVVYENLGDYARALTTNEQAFDAKQALGDRAGAAATLGNIGNIHLLLGDAAKALAVYERAWAAKVALGDKAGAALTRRNIGIACAQLGEHAKALEIFEDMRAMLEASGDKAGAAGVLADISKAYHGLGDARRSLATGELALAAQEALGDKAGAAETLGNIGYLHDELGDHSKAIEIFGRALTAMEALGRGGNAAWTLGKLASAHEARGEHERALVAARRGAVALASLARGLGSDEGGGAREPLSFVFDVGVGAAVAAKDPSELTYFLESGRAGALLESLRARQTLWATAVPQALRIEEASARRAEAAAMLAVRRAMDAGDLVTTRAARAGLDAAREKVAAVVSRIQRDAKAGAQLVLPEPATLDEIRSTLDAGDVLVEYAVLERESHALVVTRESARIVALGATTTLREAAKRLSADDVDSDSLPSLAALAERIIAPLALPETTRRLLVSPDGALTYVPFAALLPRLTVAYVPSGTTYRLLRDDATTRGRGVLALGDPDYETRVDERALAVVRGGARLSRLPATREEAKAVGDVVLLGADATGPGLRASVERRERWRAIHLACHGLVDPERPAFSSLAVTPSADDAGLLTALDVFRMKLPADLVMLSACETAKGRIYKGEGIVGLTQAFMFAGSPRVICSLWKVDDDATRVLMMKFYELWNPKDGARGLPTAEALRRAQEFVRDDAQHPKWKHPYYWAAWVLWGLPS